MLAHAACATAYFCCKTLEVLVKRNEECEKLTALTPAWIYLKLYFSILVGFRYAEARYKFS